MKLLLSLFILFLGLFRAHAVDETTAPSISKAGQLFTVELRPKGKVIEVKVAGNQVAKAELTDLGLFARLYVGKKEVVLTPVKHGQTFFISRPSSATDADSRLELKVKSGVQSETFDVELPRPQ